MSTCTTALSRRALLTAATTGLAVAGLTASAAHASESVASENATAPKYIFLFIGDGMGTTQIQLAALTGVA